MDTDMDMAIIPRSAGIGLALFSISAAHAADWKFQPAATLTETHTDNLTLSSSNRLSDFVTQVTPEIGIQEQGERTNATLDYRMQGNYYAQYSQLDHYYPGLDANANSEILKNTLYLNAGASILQQPFILAAPISTNNVNPTGNIINISTWSITPELKHRFGTFAKMDASYSHGMQHYTAGGPSLQANNNLNTLTGTANDTIDAKLDSGSRFGSLLWGLDLNEIRLSYGNSAITSKLATYTANVGYLFTPKFRIQLTGGYDNDNYVYSGPRPQGRSWNTEVDWAPTSHTKFEASAGHRYFGSTNSFNATHVTRLTSLNASYTQDVTSTILQQPLPAAAAVGQLLQAQIPNAAARQQQVQNLLAGLGTQGALFGQNVITNQIFLLKKFNASLGINLSRTMIVLSAFNSTSIPLQPPNVLLPGSLNYGTSKQQGATFSWNYQISPKLTAGANAMLTNITFPGQTFSGNTRFITFGLNRTLSLHLTGSLSLRNNMFTSNLAGPNYSENALIASLNWRN